MSIPGSAAPFLLAKQPEGQYLIERSLRFNSADSAYLSRTPASSGNRKTWTWAGWVKKSQIAPGGDFFFVDGSSTPGEYFICNWYNAGMAVTDHSYYYFRMSDVGQYLRDPSAWYHIVIALDSTAATASNRIRVYINSELLSNPSYYPTGITLNQEFGVNRASLHQIGRFNGYLADVHFIDGQALDPTSFGEFDDNGIWQPIAYSGSYGTNGFHLDFADNSTAAALGTDSSGNGNTWAVNNISVQAGNGNYITSLYTSSTSTYNGSATDTNFYSGGIGTRINGFDGNLSTVVYSADVGGGWLYFRPSVALSSVTQLRVYASYVQEIKINGTTATVSPSLPATSTQWYTITSPPSTITEIAIQGHVAQGAAGRFQAIEVNGVVLVDYRAGAGNDSLVDVPTNYGTDTGAGGEVRGNYCTLNPLDQWGANTYANGNLEVTCGIDVSYTLACGGIAMSSGKWYWEVVSGTISGGPMIGIASLLVDAPSRLYTTAYGKYYYYNGTKWTSNISTAYGASYTAGDVIGVAYDADAGTLVFYKNGASQGTAFTGLTTSGPWAPAVNNASSGLSQSFVLNFGQRPFAYTAPSGFKALCTANLPSTTITTSGSYTGNGVADGPFVYLNGVPTAMTVNGNAVTFGTHADKLSNGFKIRTTSTTYNQNASTYNYTITSTGAPFKTARAQPNP